MGSIVDFRLEVFHAAVWLTAGTFFRKLPGPFGSLQLRNGSPFPGACLDSFLVEIKNVALEMSFGRDRADIVHPPGRLLFLVPIATFFFVLLCAAINSRCFAVKSNNGTVAEDVAGTRLFGFVSVVSDFRNQQNFQALTKTSNGAQQTTFVF